jgi:hypothetical protein
MMPTKTANLSVQKEREPLHFRSRTVLGALAIGGLLGACAMDLTGDLAGRFGPAAEPTQVAREWPVRPLPREWRWSPPTVKYEHMYRSADR